MGKFVIASALLLCVISVAGIVLYIRMRRLLIQKDYEIRYREKLFSILASNTEDVFVVLNGQDYSPEYISPNIEQMLGISAEEIGDKLALLSSVEYKGGTKEFDYVYLRDLEPESSFSIEKEHINPKTGDKHLCMEIVYRTKVEDSEKYIIVVADHTRERHDKEALKEAIEIANVANRAKSNLLSNMSHNIRTPMHAIMGFCTLLKRDAEDADKVRRYAENISASNQHLLELINDVLDMSKLESGKTTLNITNIRMAELVEELDSIIRPQVRSKQQTFHITTSDIINEHILGDRERLNQILLNLLSNSVKYTPNGGHIEMSIKQLAEKSSDYATYRFVIKDNGVGMSEDYLKVIFSPFSREKKGAVKKIQGTGIGMAITKNLVDLMGGTIKVKSQLDIGTEFTVELSLKVHASSEDRYFWSKHGIERILVIGDKKDIYNSINEGINNIEVKVDFAKSGMEAMQSINDAGRRGEDYDLIIADWRMPDMEGVEIARYIRGIVSDNTLIAILSSNGLADEEVDMTGIDILLKKPFFLTNLKKSIDNLMNGRKDRHEEKTGKNIISGMHFLTAEDNELNAEIIVELLKIAGAYCDVVGNGQEAVRVFEKSKDNQYDMILMDVQMPVMDGYEATKAIRECSHPRGKTIPIIAMTANAFSEDVKAAIDSGMNAHIAKPVDMNLFSNIVRDCLEQGGHP